MEENDQTLFKLEIFIITRQKISMSKKKNSVAIATSSFSQEGDERTFLARSRAQSSPPVTARRAGASRSEGPVSKSSYFLGDPPPDPRFLASLGALSMVTYTSSRLIFQVRCSTGQHLGSNTNAISETIYRNSIIEELYIQHFFVSFHFCVQRLRSPDHPRRVVVEDDCVYWSGLW